jgi:predicted thioredoxin/glutaredoxin
MKVNLEKEAVVLIKLFGHKDCHKTKIYHSYLTEKGIQFVF